MYFRNGFREYINMKATAVGLFVRNSWLLLVHTISKPASPQYPHSQLVHTIS